MSMPGQDYEIAVPITIENAYSGTELDLDLNMPEYDAQGRLRRVPHAFKARVPKGATDGQRLRVPGKGGKGLERRPQWRSLPEHHVATACALPGQRSRSVYGPATRAVGGRVGHRHRSAHPRAARCV
jgi:hypothetical protein